MKRIILFIIVFYQINVTSGQNTIYAKYFGNNEKTDIDGTLMDTDNNLYIWGTFSGELDFDPSPQSEILNSLTTSNYLCKFNSGGDLLWVQEPEFTIWDAVLNTNNELIVLNAANNEVNKIEVIKLDNNGNVEIAYEMKNTVNETLTFHSPHLAIDENDNLYISTNFRHQINIDLKGGELLINVIDNDSQEGLIIVKYDQEFNTDWYYQLYSSQYIDINSCQTDIEGNLIISGNANGEVEFNPFNSTEISLINNSVYYLKISSTAEYIWHRSFEASVVDQTWEFFSLENITFDENNDFYGIANLAGQMDIDPDENSEVIFEAPNQIGAYTSILYKMSGDGEYLWHSILVETPDAVNNFYPMGVTPIFIDENNNPNIFLPGSFLEIDIDIRPESENIIAFDIAEGVFTSLIQRFNENGLFQGSEIMFGNVYSGEPYKQEAKYTENIFYRNGEFYYVGVIEDDMKIFLDIF